MPVGLSNLAQTGACALLLSLGVPVPCVSAAGSGTTYIPLEGCAVDEGNTLSGPFKPCDGICCEAKCEADPRCKSYSLFGVAKVCYLKDKCVTPTDPVRINKYTTWYKPCDESGEHANDNDSNGNGKTAINPADPRYQPGIQATDADAVPEILRQMHSYCIEELYSDKYKAKSGALMGSKTVKTNMEHPENTHCSNAGWRQIISKLDLQPDMIQSLIRKTEPCSAEKVYHFQMSGIGSWVSNIANVMYTHSTIAAGKGRTLAMRDQLNRESERWNLLFEHDFPICKDFEGKSTPFVRPGPIEVLKTKSNCDYAATKMFFSQQLWDMIQRGPLAGELNRAMRENIVAIRKAAAKGMAATEFSGAFIGLHLRHKWEFKLQPPKLIDVATLIQATASQINPFQHSELDHADPTCFVDKKTKQSVWGVRTVVFCASDEISQCQMLQTMLGADFYVHALENLKINTGREGILSYLLDVSLLAKAGVFIGSGSSNLSRMVNALRGPEKLSISMDIDFNTVHF